MKKEGRRYKLKIRRKKENSDSHNSTSVVFRWGIKILFTILFFLLSINEILLFITNKEVVRASSENSYVINKIDSDTESELINLGVDKKFALDVLEDKRIKNMLSVLYYEKLNVVFLSIDEFSLKESECKSILKEVVSEVCQEHKIEINTEKLVLYFYQKSGIYRLVPTSSADNYRFYLYLESVGVSDIDGTVTIENSNMVYQVLAIFHSVYFFLVVFSFCLCLFIFLFYLYKDCKNERHIILGKLLLSNNLIFFVLLLNGFMINTGFVKYLFFYTAVFFGIKIMIGVGLIYIIGKQNKKKKAS